MGGPFTHRIDPVLADLGGVYVWWYGLGFAIGFLQLHRYLGRQRPTLGLSAREVWSLTLCIIFGVLAGGRLVEIAFDEWPFYRHHPLLMPAYWLGGMATHGLLLGAAMATLLLAHRYKAVSRARRRARHSRRVSPRHGPLRQLHRRADRRQRHQRVVGGEVSRTPKDSAIRWSSTMARRISCSCCICCTSNAPTRHRAQPRRGSCSGTPSPRIFIDLFRDYPTHRLALGTGQTLNIVMAALGVALLVRSRLRRLGRLRSGARPVAGRRGRGGAAAVAAARLRVPARAVPHHSEQLDPGHPGPLRRAPSRARAFVAVSRARYEADPASGLTSRAGRWPRAPRRLSASPSLARVRDRTSLRSCRSPCEEPTAERVPHQMRGRRRRCCRGLEAPSNPEGGEED